MDVSLPGPYSPWKLASMDARDGKDRGYALRLSAEEEALLAEAVQRGDAAQRALSEEHWNLVYLIAKSYTKPLEPLPHHMKAANRGLMQAAEVFDPARGFRFSTFATHYVRQAVAQSIGRQGYAR